MTQLEIMNLILTLEDDTVLNLTLEENTECIPFEDCDPADFGF